MTNESGTGRHVSSVADPLGAVWHVGNEILSKLFRSSKHSARMKKLRNHY